MKSRAVVILFAVTLALGIGLTAAPAAAQWQSLADLMSGRFDMIMASDLQNVYVFGGYNYLGAYVRDAEKYSMSSNSWSSTTKLPAALALGRGVELNGWVYIPGGFDGSTVVGTLYAYQTFWGTYDTSLSPVPQGRYAYSLDKIGSLIYLCGGGDDLDDSHAECWKYDPSGDQWTAIASMPQARRFHGSAVVNNKLYVFGGLDENDVELLTTDVYDPGTNSWSSGTNLPITWWGGASGSGNGRIMFSHGVNNGGLYNRGYLSTPPSGPWSLQSGNVGQARMRAAFSSSVNTLWVAGGDPLGPLGFPSTKFEKYVITTSSTTTTTHTTTTTTTTHASTTTTTHGSTTTHPSTTTTTTVPTTTTTTTGGSGTTTTTQPDDDWTPPGDDDDDDSGDDSGLGGFGGGGGGGGDDDDDSGGGSCG